MSMITTITSVAATHDGSAQKAGGDHSDDIVEISLLLPCEWASDLMELSRERGQTVGQLLRSMIAQALHAAGPGD